MAILRIRTVPDPILKKKAKPVRNLDRDTLYFISDLKETLLATKDPKGAGLAASQVGKLLRIFIVRQGQKFKTFINPRIIWRSKKLNTDILPEKEWPLEGCLSIPNIYGLVKRSHEVEVQYMDEKGKTIKEKFEGFESSYVQHEYDHLEGVLFTEHTLKQGGKLHKLIGDKFEEIKL